MEGIYSETCKTLTHGKATQSHLAPACLNRAGRANLAIWSAPYLCWFVTVVVALVKPAYGTIKDAGIGECGGICRIGAQH